MSPRSSGAAPLGRRGDHVFGYASLLIDLRREGEELAVLRGHRRLWNVATDNTRTLPGYKVYLEPGTGRRPEVFVTFLNLSPDEASSVAGVLFPADETALAALDRRERNYRRVDVSEWIEEDVAGRVWTYLGTPEAEGRFREGLASGRAVVNGAYLRRVRAGFEAAGPAALAAFEASTDPLPCPVVELERVDLPA